MQPESVQSRADFVRFICELQKHYKKWENNDLPSFLEALSAYAADVDGYYMNMELDIDADLPSWRVFADIFKGATMYE